MRLSQLLNDTTYYMPRNAYQPASPIQRGFILLLLILAGFFLGACGKGGFSGLEPLPVDEYLANPGNFLGNTYLLTAQIDSQIEWEEGVGRILAIESESSKSRVPVFVPDTVVENLHVGQRYKMHVSIRKGGLIYVEDLRKF